MFPQGEGKSWEIPIHLKGNMLLLALPSSALLSSRQPRKSVSVTALWWCREAESTSWRHSGLGKRQGSLPLAAHSKASAAGPPIPAAASGFAKVAEYSPGSLSGHFLTSPSCWTSQGAPSTRAIAAAPLLAPSTPWPSLCRGLGKVGKEPQVPFALQPLSPSCYLHCPSGRDFSLWIHHPPPAPQLGKEHSAGQRCTCPPQREEHWPLVPSRALSEAMFWGRGWLPHPGV